MSNFPLFHDSVFEHLGVNTGQSNGTSVVAHDTTPHTKGPWTQVGVTGIDYDMFYVTVTHDTAARFLLDIAIGPEGSEHVIVENVYCPAERSTRLNSRYMPIEIAVPAGTRVAARTQATVVSAMSKITVLGIQGGWMKSYLGGTRVVAMGADLANTKGTQVPLGASGNSKGVWVEVDGNTGLPIVGLMPSIGPDGATTTNSAFCLLDIGVGGSGSETPVIANLPYTMSGFNDHPSPDPLPMFPAVIQTGSRVSVRVQASGITSTTPDIVLYGLVM